MIGRIEPFTFFSSSISMSLENEPRYQRQKTGQWERKNPINRQRKQNEQHTKARLGSLQDEVEQDRKELIALVDREIADGKKEGRVVAISGHDRVWRMINVKGETRHYFFARLSEGKIFIGVVVVKKHEDNKTMVVTKGYTVNSMSASKDRQGISVRIYDDSQQKLISEKNIDPEKERDAYYAYDQMTPNLKEIRKDVEENKTK